MSARAECIQRRELARAAHARELALRLADIEATVLGCMAHIDEDSTLPDQVIDTLAPIFTAIRQAVRGQRGCMGAEEFEALRSQALTLVGRDLGLTT